MHAVVDDLLALARAPDEERAVRRAAVEALGWFVYSSRRAAIVEALTAILADEGTPGELRGEARKTAGRLQQGPNDPLLP